MQYLECLSAALSDMAATYQPAERMSHVLRAVMVELRGGPDPNMNHFRLYKPSSAVVPARRGSTIDMDESESTSQVFKKRQTSRPRAGTGASGRSMGKVRTSSMSTTMSIGSTTAGGGSGGGSGLTIKPPPPPRFDDKTNNMDGRNGNGNGNSNSDGGFVLVTPRSEISSTASWPPPLSSAHEPPELSLSSGTSSTTTASSNANRHSGGTWMGAEFDPQDSISQLANAHFPELNAFGDDAGGNNGMDDGMTNLDFMSLGEGVGEWGLGKEWGSLGGGAGGSVGGLVGDLDGFPSQGSGFRNGVWE